MTQFKLYNGDCLEVLKKCPDSTMDSIVTDPPYGLSFMGKKWDYDVPTSEIWKECLRVLKPGGHLLAFGGTRTYHRLVVAIEDAGFEIRDQIQWIYGQGFPKSQDISKAIDKAAGAEREVVGYDASKARPNKQGFAKVTSSIETEGNDGHKDNGATITAPATPDAQKWSGWGTALKPANEPICLARKPLSESTIAKNVLKHGTGGMNIDAGRIGLAEGEKTPTGSGNAKIGTASFGDYEGNEGNTTPALGRFPSNVILDEDAAAVLDGQTGILKSGSIAPHHGGSIGRGITGKMQNGTKLGSIFQGDSGGASRFFYVAKASKSDRGEGNTHPTVKPIKLMEYLIKLVTPKGGTVLDPFMGSGTTGVAALRNGFKFRGVEMSPEYFEIASNRLKETT